MKRKRSQRPKRELTAEQRDALRERLERGRATLAAKRAARAAENAAAGNGLATEPGRPPIPDAAPVADPVDAAASSNAEHGISPLQAAPPPPMPERQPGDQAAKAQSILGGETAAPGDPAAPGAVLQPSAVRIDPKACVALVELANDVTIRAMAGSKGIPIVGEVEKLTKLDAGVKVQLESFAPFAVPYLEQLLAKGPVAGALIFGGVAVVAIASNLGQLKKHAPKKEAKPKTPVPQTDPTLPPVPQANGTAPSSLAAIYGSELPRRR